MRTAGIFAALAFLVVAVNGYISTFNPLHSLLYGLAASIVLGVLGYKIGYIVSHPKGRSRKKRSRRGAQKAQSGLSLGSGNTKPLTGEESFIEDIH